MPYRAFSCLLALLLAVAPEARADEEPWRAARAHYEHGVDLANHGDYRGALEEFDAAYAASPHFAVLYNIGQAEVALGRPLKAIDALSRYLKDGKDDVPAPRRQQVEAQIALLESAFAQLSVTTDPPGALVTLDGTVVGHAPLAAPVRVSPGTHVVSATRPTALPVTQIITLKEGEHRALVVPLPLSEGGVLSLQCWELGVVPVLDGEAVDLAKASLGVPVSAGKHRVSFSAPGRTWPEQFVEVPPGVRAAVFCGTVAAAAAPAPVKSENSGIPPGYFLVGGGIVVGGVALGHYLWNAGRHRDWQVNQASIDADTSEDHYERQVANNELADSIHGASAVTVGLTITAGALVAGGVTWILLDSASASPRPAHSAHLSRFPLQFDVSRERAAVAWSGAW